MNLIFSILPTLLTPLFFYTPSASATPCVVFDSSWNLLAFGGANGWNLGQRDSWASGPKVTSVSSTNRPPFDGTNTQCFLAQYFNTIYVLDGDASSPESIHIYDSAKDTWSIQKTDVSAGVDPKTSVAILDHDTNVFFAASGGKLYQLEMNQMVAAVSDPLKWSVTNPPSFNTQGYTPIMGLAQNHIHFLNVPGNTEGQANIFVIHYAYFQPEVQSYPAATGSSSTFPATTGKVAHIFTTDSTAQRYFAFIPDSPSQTYVIDVHTNTTIDLPPPAVVDKASQYAGSDMSLVQLTPAGELYYLPFDQTAGTTSASSWTKVQTSALNLNAGSSSSAASSSPSSTGSRASGTATGTRSSSSSTSTSATQANGAGRSAVQIGGVAVALFAGLFAIMA